MEGQIQVDRRQAAQRHGFHQIAVYVLFFEITWYDKGYDLIAGEGSFSL
ncbi:hypothetical protein [Streptomyces sp. NBC_01508]